MASSTTLKLTNRCMFLAGPFPHSVFQASSKANIVAPFPPTTAPKQPIKRLPASVELPAGATVEDVKKAIAKQAGIGDFNRIGLFDTATRKTLKDRKALVADIPAVSDAGEVLVKDLGAFTDLSLLQHRGRKKTEH